MKIQVHWIDIDSSGQLGIIPRPRGGDWLEDEIKSLRESRTEIICSLLEPQEVEELNLQEEESFCEINKIRYLSFPIVDRNVPNSVIETLDLSRKLKEELEIGRKVVIHCRQGIGRSSLLAASIMVLMGYDSEEAFDLIANARGCAVPDTSEQRDWVKSHISKPVDNGRAT